jgi:hypothetical protein
MGRLIVQSDDDDCVLMSLSVMSFGSADRRYELQQIDCYYNE